MVEIGGKGNQAYRHCGEEGGHQSVQEPPAQHEVDLDASPAVGRRLDIGIVVGYVIALYEILGQVHWSQIGQTVRHQLGEVSAMSLDGKLTLVRETSMQLKSITFMAARWLWPDF